MSLLDFIAKDMNSFIWGKFGIALLLSSGILMSVITKFFQISHFGHWIKNTLGSIFRKDISAHSDDANSISQFQAMCTALAATVGTGNIAGVAGAIITGGPGAVFWMWVSAFFGMMSDFAENILGIYFRRRHNNGEWAGGAMYIIQYGLGSKKHFEKPGKILAGLFSFFTITASFGIGNMTQANTISGNMSLAFNIPPWLTGVVLTSLTALVILGGIKRIAAVAEKLVPFMSLVYIVGTLVIIFANIELIGETFISVFRFAFTPTALGGGSVGLAIQTGFKRGMFSNEAGLGSSVSVHASSNVKEPVQQGMWGIFEVFFDTVIVCSLTAAVVLSSGIIDLSTGVVAGEFMSAEQSTLVARAFSGNFGNAGGKFIAVAVLFFAFASILGWSCYGVKSWVYLFGEKSQPVYKIIFAAVLFAGCIIKDAEFAWNISDTFNGLMMIPNLIGVLSQTGLVMRITGNYVDRKIKGKTGIRPMLSAFPDIENSFIAQEK